MADIQTAFNYCVQACNDPYIGYSQGPRRTTIKLGVTYNTYCDCSSLMSWCLTNAGYFRVNPWFTTRSMQAKLLALGFTELSAKTNAWQPGDILWRTGHTEMVYSASGTGGRTMGAHNGNVAFANQVSIHSYKDYGSEWTYLYRAPGAGPVPTEISWHQSNDYFADYGDEQYDNAVLIHAYLQNEGWTDAAIAGLLGNMQNESTINPGLWEGRIPLNVNHGYGLVQWTPAINKYYGYAVDHNIDITDPDINGPAQLAYLIDTHANEYYPTSAWPQTWNEFITMTDPEDAASVFMHNYERPGSYQHEQERRDHAAYWYNEMQNGWPSDPGGTGGNSIHDILGGIIWDQRRRKVRP